MTVRQPHDCLSPEFGTTSRSPEVSSTTFAAHLPNLQPRTLMDMDFVASSQLVQPKLPHIRFLSVPGAPGLHASLEPCLATTLLRFANTSPPSGCVEDFHLQVDEHARHTKKGHKHCSYGPLVRNINLFNSKRLLITPVKQRRRPDLISERGLLLQTLLRHQLMGQYA